MDSSDDIGDLIRQHRQIFRECKQIIATVETQERQYWRQRAGPVVDVMSQNRQEAERCLQHPDGKVRSAALNMLMYEWNASSDPHFLRSCERMALVDPDYEVRSLALTCLGSCYQSTGDGRIGKLLAELVFDTSLPDDVRTAAYSSLFALCGERDAHLELFLDFRFSDNVDWEFVERFLTGNPPPPKPDQLAVAPPSLSEDERTGFTYFQQGVQFLEAGEYQKAVILLSEAINRLPFGAGGYRMRGRAHMLLDKLDEAIADFTRAIEIYPQSATAFYDRGQAYRQKGLIDLAEEDYRRAADLGEKGHS